ncbi:hypothetical protein LINPERPRIM_LOCUS5860 [Linum perenne]
MEPTHHTPRAIKKREFAEFLSRCAGLAEEAMCLAKLAIRPDLNDVVLPELCRLRELAEERMASLYLAGGGG